MEVSFEIPDDIANHMTQAGVDVSRRALESFALEEFKGGRITKPELRRLLGWNQMEAGRLPQSSPDL